MQHVEQRFIQFLIQTKHFNISNSLGFPLTVIESFQSLLWERLWCSGCPKSITIIWGTTAANVNTDKWQPDSDQNFISQPSGGEAKHLLLLRLLGFCRSCHFHKSLLKFSAFAVFHCNVPCSYKLSAWVYRPALTPMASGPNWNVLQTH